MTATLQPASLHLYATAWAAEPVPITITSSVVAMVLPRRLPFQTRGRVPFAPGAKPDLEGLGCREQDDALALGCPAFGRLGRREVQHEVTEALNHVEVEGLVRREERHDGRGGGELLDALGCDGHGDGLTGDRILRFDARRAADHRDDQERVQCAPGVHRLAIFGVETVIHLRDGETPKTDDPTLVVPENAGPTVELRYHDRLGLVWVRSDFHGGDGITLGEQVINGDHDTAALLVDVDGRSGDRARQVLNGRLGLGWAHCDQLLFMLCRSESAGVNAVRSWSRLGAPSKPASVT